MIDYRALLVVAAKAVPVTTSEPTRQRISGPAELLQAIPYLLGFHPAASVVLIGLHGGMLVVTARVDLDDCSAALLRQTVAAMCAGGSSEFVAACYLDVARDAATQVLDADPPVAALPLLRRSEDAVSSAGCELTEQLVVAGARWWSLMCSSRDCCPPAGHELAESTSAFAADATLRGVVALPDRRSLEGTLDPLQNRGDLLSVIEGAERAAVTAVLDGQAARHRRSTELEVLTSARASDSPGWSPVDDAQIARMAVALGGFDVRDAVWLAVDARRVDGRPLWRDLARRLPAPYDARALFLFGWASWRAGNGALAGIAAERVVASDPDYTAADLLLGALSQGLDPRALPPLGSSRAWSRLPRSA